MLCFNGNTVQNYVCIVEHNKQQYDHVRSVDEYIPADFAIEDS